MTFVQAATFLDDPEGEIDLPHDGLLDSIFYSIDQLDTYSSGIFDKNEQARFYWYELFLDESYSAGYVLPHQRGLKLKAPKDLDHEVAVFMEDILRGIRDTYSQEEAQSAGLYAARLFNVLNKTKSRDIEKIIKKLPSDLSDLNSDVTAVAVVLAPSLFTCGKETADLNRKEANFKRQIAIDFAFFFSRTYFHNFATKA
jgi:hypothetical protein